MEDKAGQCIHMQIHNMNDIECDVNRVVTNIPVGARFYLKNPFLKVGNDGWWLLRVDQPFDLERLDIPPLHGSILVVGDGDFSFSAALAKQNRERGQAQIVTSSLDSKKTILHRYAKGEDSLESLSGDPSVSTFFRLNASNLSRLGGQEFDSIVWNFPYPQERSPMHPGSSCAQLMSECLVEMVKYLKPNGRMYITLAKNQSGSSYEAASPTLAWDIETVASEAGADIVDVVPFEQAVYEGYEPRRAYADEPFPSSNAKTVILRLKQDLEPGDQPSSRTTFSRCSSWLLDSPWTSAEAVIDRENVIQQLATAAQTSKTAQSLLDAAEAFHLSQKILEIKPRSLYDCAKVTASLSQVLSTEDGELTILFKRDQLIRALVCVRLVLASFFAHNGSSPSALLDTNGSDSVGFIGILRRVYEKAGKHVKNQQNVVSFEGSLLVFAFLTAMAEGTDSSLETFSIAKSLAPKSEELAFFHVAMKGKAMHEKSEQHNEYYSKAEILEVIYDCEASLELIQTETHHRYASILYILARLNLDLSILSMKSDNSDTTAAWKAIALYKTYIDLVEPDSRRVANAHYRLGLLHTLVGQSNQTVDPKLVRSHYVAGLSAEKDLLSFFGPVKCPFKRLVELAIMTKSKPGESVV